MGSSLRLTSASDAHINTERSTSTSLNAGPEPALLTHKRTSLTSRHSSRAYDPVGLLAEDHATRARNLLMSFTVGVSKGTECTTGEVRALQEDSVLLLPGLAQ